MGLAIPPLQVGSPSKWGLPYRSAAGTSLAQVVKTTVYLADMADFVQMNEVYAKHFGTHKPARSTVQAAGLPKGARVEIDVIALTP